MTVLHFQNVNKTFGDKVVLHQASFSIHPQERVGLIGPNGAGKSTLLKLAMGEIESDVGSIVVAHGVEVGYLPQTLRSADDWSIEQYLLAAQRALRDMEKRMNELTQQMAMASEDDVTGLSTILQAYGELSSRFEARRGYELEYRTGVVLQGLGLGDMNPSRLLNTLSGGQKTRVGLAALLISAPDVLLLDEPTNHLDVQTLTWLEDYLNGYQGALLVISHDRKFLNRTVTKIVALDEYTHGLTEYTGNYDAYLEQRQKEKERWSAAYQEQQEEIRKLKERMAETMQQGVGHNRPIKDNNKMAFNKAGHNVQAAAARNIRAAEKQLERIQENPVPRPPEPMRFSPEFDPNRVPNKLALIVSQVAIELPTSGRGADGGQDNRTLLQNVNLTLGNQGRMLIVGPNGCGKTTLLNVIARKQKPRDGSLYVVPQISVGYLEQEITYEDPRATVLDDFSRGKVGHRDEHVAVFLSYQLFHYDEMLLPVGSLSPGQHRKLQLAKLMDSGANMLLIDEPTNHLSFDVLEEFEQAIQRFPGPVIVVSHDRWFIEKFHGEVWTVEGGRLHPPALALRWTAEEEESLVSQIQSLSAYEVNPQHQTLDITKLLDAGERAGKV